MRGRRWRRSKRVVGKRIVGLGWVRLVAVGWGGMDGMSVGYSENSET